MLAGLSNFFTLLEVIILLSLLFQISKILRLLEMPWNEFQEALRILLDLSFFFPGEFAVASHHHCHTRVFAEFSFMARDKVPV